VNSLDPLPNDLAVAHAMIRLERAARLEAEARARQAEAEVSSTRLEIERLKLLLAKARREQYGRSSERGAKLIEQLELQLADLEESAAEEEMAAEIAAPTPERATRSGSTRKPARRPLPENLPRERIVYPAPCACPKCGGPVRKLGEDVTESLECERGAGRWSSMCGRRSAAAAVRRSVSRQHLRTRLPAGEPGRTCWRSSWPPSTASTCHSLGRVRSTPEKGLSLTSPR
jgi:hypothetical protein